MTEESLLFGLMLIALLDSFNDDRDEEDDDEEREKTATAGRGCVGDEACSFRCSLDDFGRESTSEIPLESSKTKRNR